MKYCGQCGQELKNEVRFCHKCGTASEPVSSNEPPTENTIECNERDLEGGARNVLVHNEIDNKNLIKRFIVNNKKRLIVAGLILVLVVGILASILQYKNYKYKEAYRNWGVAKSEQAKHGVIYDIPNGWDGKYDIKQRSELENSLRDETSHAGEMCIGPNNEQINVNNYSNEEMAANCIEMDPNNLDDYNFGKQQIDAYFDWLLASNNLDEALREDGLEIAMQQKNNELTEIKQPVEDYILRNGSLPRRLEENIYSRINLIKVLTSKHTSEVIASGNNEQNEDYYKIAKFYYKASGKLETVYVALISDSNTARYIDIRMVSNGIWLNEKEDPNYKEFFNIVKTCRIDLKKSGQINWWKYEVETYGKDLKFMFMRLL